MNTQDERKAFEEWHFLDWKLNCAVLDTVEEARIIYDRIYKRSNPDSKFEQEQSFRAWQAAKAQAVPDGYKVVPVNYECVWCGCTELDGWTDETMIEAQEPAND